MTTLDGMVIAIQANYYWVRLTDFPRSPLLCTRRTRLKKIGQKVMVGDRVLVELPPSWQDNMSPSKVSPPSEIIEGDLGAIVKCYSRQTEIERPPVANAEQICLVFALDDPPLDVWQLSRFLVQAEATQIPIQLCLNKTDLLDSLAVSEWQQRLQGWGYDPLLFSVRTGEGMVGVQSALKNRMSLLAGPSGVGKSSLLNLLVPSVEQRVNRVSGKLRRGRHTTRHVELFTLPDGGLLADTPGFNQPTLAIAPAQLVTLFPEVCSATATSTCYFHNCFHRDEPDCVIPRNWERYEHYLTFLEELLQQQTPGSSKGETGTKRKVGNDGRDYFEPKLASKKYRRHSRRQRHQEVQDLLELGKIEEWVDIDEIDD